MNNYNAVDQFLNETYPGDQDLERAARNSEAKGLPNIAVSYQQARFLTVLAQIAWANRVLEIGTLGGLSTIALAKAGEYVTVDTLEFDPTHAATAAENIALADLSHRVTVYVGDALETLRDFAGNEQHLKYDFVFIDADKDRNLEYFLAVLPLCQHGATILVDNVIREGRCLTVDNKRKFLEAIAKSQVVQSCVIQTVGEKTWDGFVLAKVVGS